LKKIFLSIVIDFFTSRFKNDEDQTISLIIPFFGVILINSKDLKELSTKPNQNENQEIIMDVKFKVSPSLKELIHSKVNNKSGWIEEVFLLAIRKNLEDKLI